MIGLLKPVLAAATAVAIGIRQRARNAQNKTYRVGVSLPEAQNPFYVQLGSSAVATLKQRGIEATLLSANSDVNEQINNINDLVASKVDADPDVAARYRRTGASG